MNRARSVNTACEDNYLEDDIPFLSSILSDITSGIGEATQEILPSIFAPSPRASSTSVVVITTQTTIVRTSLTTQRYPSTSSTLTSQRRTPSACGSSTFTGKFSFAATSSGSASASTSQTSPVLTSSTTNGLPSSTGTSAPSSSTASSGQTIRHKHAIVGGLCGAIAGLVLIGIAAFYLSRRRRQQQKLNRNLSNGSIDEVISEFINPEKRFPPPPPPAITNPTRFTTPTPLPPPHASHYTRTVTPEPYRKRRKPPFLDDHLIRVSQDRWPRPFAFGGGYRDLTTRPQKLRVTNPDAESRSASRATTPQKPLQAPPRIKISLPPPPPPRLDTVTIGLALTTTTPTPTFPPTPLFPKSDDNNSNNPFLTPPSPTGSAASRFLHPLPPPVSLYSSSNSSCCRSLREEAWCASTASDPFELDWERGAGEGENENEGKRWRGVSVYEGT